MTRVAAALVLSTFVCSSVSAQQAPISPVVAQGIADTFSRFAAARSSSQQIGRQTMNTINARVGRVSEQHRGDIFAGAFYNEIDVKTGFDDLELGTQGNALVSALQAATGESSRRAVRTTSDLYHFLVGADYQISSLSVGVLGSYARFDINTRTGPLLTRLGATRSGLEGDAWLAAAYANYLFTPSLYSTVIAAYGKANGDSANTTSRYVGFEGSLNFVAASGPLVLQGRTAFRHLGIRYDRATIARIRQIFPQLPSSLNRKDRSDLAIIGGDATWLMSRRVQPFLRATYELALNDLDRDGLHAESGLTFNFSRSTAISAAAQWTSFGQGTRNKGGNISLRSSF